MNIASARGPPSGIPRQVLSKEEAQTIIDKRKTQILKHVTSKPISTKRKKPKKSKKTKRTEVKIAVRFLPPEIKEEEVWHKFSIKAKDNDNINPSVISMYFIQGKYSLKPFKNPIYSRAYILFKNSEIASSFVQSFKEIVFEDEKESSTPSFSRAIYPKMPEMDKLKPTGLNGIPDLTNLPSYKLFLKFKSGEIERRASFLNNNNNNQTVEDAEINKDLKKDKIDETKSSKKPKKKDEKSKDSKTKDPKAKESKPKESKSKDSKVKSQKESKIKVENEPKVIKSIKSRPSSSDSSKKSTPEPTETSTNPSKPKKKKSKKPEKSNSPSISESTTKPTKLSKPSKKEKPTSINPEVKPIIISKPNSIPNNSNKPISKTPTIKKILKKEESSEPSKPKPKMLLRRP